MFHGYDIFGEFNGNAEVLVVAGICGDANGDEALNVGDAVHLNNYVFKSGPAPDQLCIRDCNDDDAVIVGDAVFLINYVLKTVPHR